MRTLAVAYRPVESAVAPAADDALEHELVFGGVVGMIDPAASGGGRGRRRGAWCRAADHHDHRRPPAHRRSHRGRPGDRRTERRRVAGCRRDRPRARSARRCCLRRDRSHDLRVRTSGARAQAAHRRFAPGRRRHRRDDRRRRERRPGSQDRGHRGRDGHHRHRRDQGGRRDGPRRRQLRDHRGGRTTKGRAIFANIRKFLRYLLSSNIGEVLTMFLGVVGASVIGLDEGGVPVVAPLLATQILWINLLTDSAPALALGVDPPPDDLMRRPPRRTTDRIVDREMQLGVVFIGVVMAVATLLTLDIELPGGLFDGSSSVETARTAAFTVLVLAQLFNCFNSRSERQERVPRPVHEPAPVGSDRVLARAPGARRARRVPQRRLRHDTALCRRLVAVRGDGELGALGRRAEEADRAACGARPRSSTHRARLPAMGHPDRGRPRTDPRPHRPRAAPTPGCTDPGLRRLPAAPTPRRTPTL